MKPSFAIVAAMDAELGIGKNGTLPWQLSADLKHFKTVTTTCPPNKKNVVIMGRKTWDSLPASYKPLPGRINLVLSHQKNLTLPPEVLMAQSLDAALIQLGEGALKNLIDKVFVIGGADIFRQSLSEPGCNKLYLTHISQSFHCDRFFPKEFGAIFKSTQKSPPAKENTIDYYFAEYERR